MSKPDVSVNIDVETRYKEMLYNEVLRRAADFTCTIFMFGSRVTGKIKRSSDFDLGVLGLNQEKFEILKNRLDGIEDDLNILHNVDVINFETADSGFKKLVRDQGVEIWKQG